MRIENKYLWYGAGILGGSVLLFLLLKVAQKKYNLTLFDSPDLSGSGKNMDKSFLAMLKKAEKYAGFKFTFNSGFRTPRHNKEVGGVSNSSHTIGKAVDIKASTIAKRDKIVWAAKKAGFKRIGIGKTFVHLDSDATKPQYVTWGYPKGNKPPFQVFV